ncbi:ubiquinol-cytochrome-c reductase complex assembly factor 3-like [Strongylocentrotus purpuratus]|uniref:Ubiquinol-cytochrome-c reductase complex assembly factor 3 n=1 Tax=Strongylocentrotus purpuratus TaxID=7668 RepID=A0A7M7HL74_STRPU|nr:ubiquinol-cytochrome-c reductase complex assembly factor 3-like [Strongylocentrotus purpuratus]|eukprot:XP_011674861.1 PREDICTED: ubiquinol-cytochrome-c reductase complex assembly factor 3-like [Strongylocentrotus purpuratus]
MSKVLRYVMSIGIMGGSLLGGWVLMNTITPDPEELLKRLPEADPVKMAESKQRTKELVAALKAAAESPHPIYKDIKRE